MRGGRVRLGHGSLLSRIALMLLFLSLSGCAASDHMIDREESVSGMRTILVLPFKDISRIYGTGKDVRCSLCGNTFISGPVENGAVVFLTEALLSFLEAKTEYRVVPYQQAEGVVSQVLAEQAPSLSERAFLLAVGKKLGVEGVLSGHLYRFRDREGNPYAVISPGSVVFDIHLMRVEDGKIIWVGCHSETQRSLTEDLLQVGTFVKRGGVWLTAWDLASFGLEQILSSLPKP